jgi:hypothetical protein
VFHRNRQFLGYLRDCVSGKNLNTYLVENCLKLTLDVFCLTMLSLPSAMYVHRMLPFLTDYSYKQCIVLPG